MSEVMKQEELTSEIPLVTSKRLLEAGVHFGHQTRRWNPKMKPYIYTARNGIYIIEVEKTIEKIEEGYAALKNIVERGGRVLFVGTKRAAQEIIIEEALRSGSFFVTNRWLGGTMTNFKTIQKSIKRLKDIEKMQEDGIFDILPKIEVLALRKEAERLEKNLGGIKEMRRVPDAIFVVDPRIEATAIKEARKLKIPIFGIVDTNCDPDDVDYVIPGNDDATKSIKLLVSLFADAIVEARGGETIVAYKSDEELESKQEETTSETTNPIRKVKSKELEEQEETIQTNEVE